MTDIGDEMTVEEVVSIGHDERLAKLIGSYRGPGGIARIIVRRTGVAEMRLYLVVGEKEQDCSGIDAQLRLEHAIADGILQRI